MTSSMDLRTRAASLRARIRNAMPSIGRDVIGFGLVGLGGMVIDLVVFNALRLGVLGPGLSLMAKPLTASVISASVAIVFNWVGGRYWVFRAERRSNAVLEFVEYALVALLGLGIGLATLAFTHYTLGFTSLTADNISKNVIGLGLGTVTRFLLLRFWVWGRNRGGAARPAPVPTATAAIPVVPPAAADIA